MALLVLPMVTSATMMTNALTAAPAYMSQTAFRTEGGRSGVCGAGSAPPVGYGWYMTAPGWIPGWRAERLKPRPPGRQRTELSGADHRVPRPKRGGTPAGGGPATAGVAPCSCQAVRDGSSWPWGLVRILMKAQTPWRLTGTSWRRSSKLIVTD